MYVELNVAVMVVLLILSEVNDEELVLEVAVERYEDAMKK